MAMKNSCSHWKCLSADERNWDYFEVFIFDIVQLEFVLQDQTVWRLC